MQTILKYFFIALALFLLLGTGIVFASNSGNGNNDDDQITESDDRNDSDSINDDDSDEDEDINDDNENEDEDLFDDNGDEDEDESDDDSDDSTSDDDLDDSLDGSGQNRGPGGSLDRIRSNMEERRNFFDDRQAQRVIDIENRREIQQERITEMKDRIDKRKDDIQEHRINARIALSKRITVRLENIYERLSVIITKIDTRIEVLASEGVSIDEGKKYIAEAKTHLDLATTAITEAQAFADSWITLDITGTPDEVNATLLENSDQYRSLIQTAREELRAAYESMKQAIKSLKESLPEKQDDNSGDDSSS